MPTDYYEKPRWDGNIIFAASSIEDTRNFDEFKEKRSLTRDAITSVRRSGLIVDENFAKERNKQTLEESSNSLSTRFTQQPIVWFNVFAILVFHVGSIYGFFATVLQTKFLTLLWAEFVGLYSAFGVAAGVHRLWCHRSYKVKQPLKIILLICYTTAGLNSVYRWVKDHRIHHKYTDTDADPHNTNRGFFFAHIGWLMQKKHPDVVKKAATIDMNDITNDPLLAFHTKYFVYLKILFCFILPTIPPIWLWHESWLNAVVWLMFIRYTFLMNVVLSVNSFAHFYGQKPYNKWITSTDNHYVSFFGFGEGYHNFHHVFPWHYRSPEWVYYWKFDLATNLIDLFQKIGWAYDTKTASIELVKSTMMKSGDGTGIAEVPIEYVDKSNAHHND